MEYSGRSKVSNIAWKIFLMSIKAVSIFIFTSVISKLFMHNENWKNECIIYSCSFAVANIIVIAVELIKFKNMLKTRIVVYAILLVYTFFLIAFIFGVILDSIAWQDIAIRIMVPFSISIIVNSKWNICNTLEK